jgi:hypothetical protein
MARELFRSSINLERPKHVLDKPIVVGEELTWLYAESESTGESMTSGRASSSGTSSVQSEAVSLNENFGCEGNEAYSYSAQSGSGKSSSESGSESHSESASSSSSRGWSRSESYIPVRVAMPTAVHSLDEELHLAAARLRELPNRVAVVKRRGHPPIALTPPFIGPAINGRGAGAAFVEHSRATSQYLSRSAEADEEIVTRRARLRALSKLDAPETADAFWES